VSFLEALQPEFKVYQQEVKANAALMAQVLMERGYKIVSGGTENHMFLLDLIDKGITGKDADAVLDAAHITVNKNAVPNDPRSPFVTSGLRLGTPAVTTRGFRATEIRQLTGWIADILDDIKDEKRAAKIRQQVIELCGRFPVYQ
jgi:glycine hydroxymethyltransferase